MTAADVVRTLADPSVLFGLAAVLALGALLGARTSSRRRRAAIERRARRARESERDAEALLERMGFEVVDRQVIGTAHVIVEGERVETMIRADYAVERWGERGIVEVKSGADVRDPACADTRRQLLEYWFAFPGHTIYHLDTSTGRLERVAFAHRGRPRRWRWLVAGVALAALAALAWWLASPRIGP